MSVPLTLSSVPAQTPYVQYVSGAAQTVFPYPFEITQDSDLVVALNAVTQPTDSGYSLSGQGSTSGGNVTFATGLNAGTIVTLYRNITISRITQLAQNGTFFSSNFNNEYNKIYLILQQLQQSLLPGGNQAFALMVPNTNNPAPTTLLTPASYANKYLSFDSNGNPIPALLTSSGAVTAPIIGSLLYPQTTAETNASVVPTSLQYAPGDIRRYGATAGAASAGLASAIAQNQQGGVAVYVPAGTWQANVTLTGTFDGLRIYGDGMFQSIIQSASTTAHAIQSASGSILVGVVVEDLQIKANAAQTTGSGFFLTATPGQSVFAFTMRNVFITGSFVSGFVDSLTAFGSMFQSVLDNVLVSGTSSHSFDIGGDNTVTLRSCYALNLTIGNGSCGYRIRSASPLLQSCNGINSGDYWGIFGTTGSGSYCSPTLDNCNVEQFTIAGIWGQTSGFISKNTTYITHFNGTKAIQINGANPNIGTLDRDNFFLFNSGGLTWLNGFPVHVITTSGVPFAQVISSVNTSPNAQFTWYDEVQSAAVSMSTIYQSAILTNRWANSTFDQVIAGIQKNAYSGTAAFSTATTAAVVFGTALPAGTTSYKVALGGNAAGYVWVTAKANTGFTINCSNSNSNPTDWWITL